MTVFIGYLFQSTVGNYTESNMSGIQTLLDLMSVGDTDFSPPATAVSFFLIIPLLPMFTPRSKRFLIICLLNKRINYQMNHNQFIYSLSLILFLCNKINLFAQKEYFFKNPTAKRLRDHPSYSFHKMRRLL